MSDQQSDTKNYIAIIDIGSNAVRLVVYDGLNRAPFKIHSERSVCNLGADLATTGRLRPESIRKALDSILRFSGLLAAMKIDNISAVATAALRDAEDGKEFIALVQRECGLKIRVIDGDEEARLAALGVLSNGLGGNGVIGDYGGGSLELIGVENFQVKHKISLPLGSHRLLAEQNRAARIKTIERHLDSVEFIQHYEGRHFYAMGGAWRSMAKAHLYMTHHPLKLLDHYHIDGKKAAEFAELLSRQSTASLEKTVGLSKKRVKDMGAAALTMERLFMRLKPQKLLFSGTGLREGLVFDQLAPSAKKRDALIASCMKIALKISRFDDLKAFHVLAQWIKPLFAEKDADFARLLEASCLLSDTSWFEHEDYQAEHAFQRILVMPFYGADHETRAFLALSQYVRYRGYIRRRFRAKNHDEVTGPIQRMLDHKMMDSVVVAGLAQRMGYLLTGGALGLLKHTELVVTPEKLVLRLHNKTGALNAEIIGGALKSLAGAMGKEPNVEWSER